MILYILEHGRSKKTDVYDGLPNSGLAKKLDSLEKAGIVSYDRRRFENNTTFVELTPLGRIIAKKLDYIEKAMQGKLSAEDIDSSFPEDR